MYRRFLGATLSEPAVIGVVTWGLSDRYSWLRSRRTPRFARADGQPTRPLPFDEELRPKPAFTAILEAFQTAPARGA
jgi:endo-1,4-beta-xylanase